MNKLTTPLLFIRE